MASRTRGLADAAQQAAVTWPQRWFDSNTVSGMGFLRRHRPVLAIPVVPVVVTRREDVLAVLEDSDTFVTPRAGGDRDYVLGDTGGTGKMTIPVRGGPPLYIDAQPEIVLTRGAEYLFAPGIAALRLLAAGAFA